jgi:cell volume regulation protein A
VAVGKSFGIGIAVGAVVGVGWVVLHRLWSGSRHEYPLTLGALLLLYVLVDRAGGSPALGILAAAVCIGNAATIAQLLHLPPVQGLDPTLQALHGSLTFMVKSFFFTFIGLMLGPPWGLFAIGVLFGLVLLGIRIPAVTLATARSPLERGEKRIVAVSLPRGMAAGVLAMMPAYAGVPGTESLPVVVFAAVVTTIALFAVGFPLAKRGLAVVASGAGVVAAPDARIDDEAAPSVSAEAEPAAVSIPLPTPLPLPLGVSLAERTTAAVEDEVVATSNEVGGVPRGSSGHGA